MYIHTYIYMYCLATYLHISKGVTGGIGGLVGRSVAFPFDTLKVKRATNSEDPNMIVIVIIISSSSSSFICFINIMLVILI